MGRVALLDNLRPIKLGIPGLSIVRYELDENAVHYVRFGDVPGVCWVENFEVVLCADADDTVVRRLEHAWKSRGRDTRGSRSKKSSKGELHCDILPNSLATPPMRARADYYPRIFVGSILSFNSHLLAGASGLKMTRAARKPAPRPMAGFPRPDSR